jgi:hypothetical protein
MLDMGFRPRSTRSSAGFLASARRFLATLDGEVAKLARLTLAEPPTQSSRSQSSAADEHHFVGVTARTRWRPSSRYSDTTG